MKSSLLLLLPAILGINAGYICNVNERIFGGEKAEKSEFPGLVHFQEVCRRNGSRSYAKNCAGSLISEHWVLTAAHCLALEPFEEFQSIRVFPTKRHPDYIESKHFITHEEFQFENFHNDIALIRLPVSMPTIYPHIKVTPIPLQGQPLTSNEVTLVGWGVTSAHEEGVYSPYLQKLEHVPLDQTLCQEKGFSPDEALCRNPTRATGTSCHGDSGGPVYMDGVQVGIVSNDLTPQIVFHSFFTTTAVDTRVSGYRNWIDEKIRLHTS